MSTNFLFLKDIRYIEYYFVFCWHSAYRIAYSGFANRLSGLLSTLSLLFVLSCILALLVFYM